MKARPRGGALRAHAPRSQERQEEAYAVGLQPSASRTAQLIECSYAFGKQCGIEEPSEAARYGSAFHGLMALRAETDLKVRRINAATAIEIAQRWGFEDPEKFEGLKMHVATSYRYFTDWLSGQNEYRIDFARMKGERHIETALAWTPFGKARLIEGHDDDHRYHGLVPNEQPGTLDYGFVPASKATPVLMVDLKSGEEDFSDVLRKPQLLTLGIALARATGRKEVIIGALHSRRRTGLPKMYTERVALDDELVHEHEKKVHLGLSRIGDGSMRPNPTCDYCLAKNICPARDARLLDRAGDVLTGLTAAGGALSTEGLRANDVAIIKTSPAALDVEKRLGLLYEIARLAERMAGRARDEIQREMLASRSLLPVTRSDEYLVLRSFEKETVSKGGIIAAYGKKAGERLLAKLRKDGAMKMSKVTGVWPEKERGK